MYYVHRHRSHTQSIRLKEGPDDWNFYTKQKGVEAWGFFGGGNKLWEDEGRKGMVSNGRLVMQIKSLPDNSPQNI